MNAPLRNAKLANLWDDAHAATLDEPGKLTYRSNLLGSDLRITNFGGGNTSAKVDAIDPLTEKPVKVLWVKGSGGDHRLDEARRFCNALHGQARGAERVLQRTFRRRTRWSVTCRTAPSISTRALLRSIPPLHAFVPYAHVDHMHPDALIAIAAAKNSERLTNEIFGGELGWLPWQRPGFDLGLKLGKMSTENSKQIGVVLGAMASSPGATPRRRATRRRCGSSTRGGLAGSERSQAGLQGCAVGDVSSADGAQRSRARLMPAIRGRISASEPKAGHFTDAPEVLEFVELERDC